MKSKLTLLLLLLPFLVYAQEVVKDGVYRWPSFNAHQKNVTINMLTGSAYDLAYLEVSAQFLPPGKKTTVHVPGTEEQLLFVKNGNLTITLKDSVFSLSK